MEEVARKEDEESESTTVVESTSFSDHSTEREDDTKPDGGNSEVLAAISIDIENGASEDCCRETYIPQLVCTKQTIFCPITKKPFKCAVVHPKDGISYEKEAVEERDGDTTFEYYPNRALMEFLDPATDSEKEVSLHLNEKGVFLCPITRDLFRDPVIDHEGNTFERTSIVGWIQKHGVSPITRNSLRVDQLYDNVTLLTVLVQEMEQQAERGLISDECGEINAWKRDMSSPSSFVAIQWETEPEQPNPQLEQPLQHAEPRTPRHQSDDNNTIRHWDRWHNRVGIAVSLVAIIAASILLFNCSSLIAVLVGLVLFCILYSCWTTVRQA
ncbi:Ubox [Seminavis robusta]|uniref:Ubox n=1 Tax=Seminavis robusta TaxID=568900 RepID=A0A9N8HER4_9STRA|nr:Ubox [Seminavis robusta]|eukprot:Sro316_g115440.1 Ubox (328) ;mRNA; r:6072-7055